MTTLPCAPANAATLANAFAAAAAAAAAAFLEDCASKVVASGAGFSGAAC